VEQAIRVAPSKHPNQPIQRRTNTDAHVHKNVMLSGYILLLLMSAMYRFKPQQASDRLGYHAMLT
jgi:hypothetical protein